MQITKIKADEAFGWTADFIYKRKDNARCVIERHAHVLRNVEVLEVLAKGDKNPLVWGDEPLDKAMIKVRFLDDEGNLTDDRDAFWTGTRNIIAPWHECLAAVKAARKAQAAIDAVWDEGSALAERIRAAFEGEAKVGDVYGLRDKVVLSHEAAEALATYLARR